jgi:hypothetical protein
VTTFLRLIAAMLAAACIALVVGIEPSGAARAGNSVTYQDSTGEDSASLDIQQIVVSNDDAGLLTFEIHLGNVSALTGKNDVAILIDSDNNPADGGTDYSGADIGIDVSGGSADLIKWDGSHFAFSQSPSSLTYGFANGVLTVRVKASDLGLTSFNFYVFTDTDYSADGSNVDFAPDRGHGTFAYEVKISPPAAVTTPKPVKKTVPKCKKGHKSSKAHPCHR